MRKETTKHHERQLAQKARAQKIKQRRKDRLERKKTGQIIHMPHTLETLRIPDETIPEDDDKELLEEEENDEVSDIFSGERIPKILLTVADRVCPRTIGFCKELARVIPNTFFYHRRRCDLKKLIPKAVEKGFTCLVVINEDQKKPNGLLLCHLPNGPSALFKMSNVKLMKEIKSARKNTRIEQVTPQLIVNRFQTRLGIRVSRLLSGLFPVKEATIARRYHRAVTFHNQRDFIFFRSHRFKVQESFGSSGTRERVQMLELGPRFTLKLRSLQSGTFDSKLGEYEWVHKRHEMDTSRRKFHL